MNIKKKILFTLVLFLKNNTNGSLDKLSEDLILVSPFASAMRAIISAYIAYYLNDRINPAPAEKPLVEESLQQESQSKKLFHKTSKKIIDKYGSLASDMIWSGLYTNFCLDKTTHNIVDNPYLTSQVKEHTTDSLGQVSNELSMFGNFFELFAGYNKVKKNITRLTKRMTEFSIQTIGGALALAGLYKVATDKTKNSVTSLVNKISYLNDRPYAKNGVNLIIPILCDILVLAPAFEHYLVPGVQGIINYYSPNIPTKEKLDNGLKLMQLSTENFYEYKESENIKDFKDIYNCLKYAYTIEKCLKNCKFLNIFKYIPFDIA